MSAGKKPSLQVSPRRASPADVQSKMGALESAHAWAQVPAITDAINAGLRPSASTQVESEESGVGDDPTPMLGTPLKSLTSKREKRNVSHLLKLSPEINERLENLIDHIPRASKQRLIIRAVEEYLSRVERVIERHKAAG